MEVGFLAASLVLFVVSAILVSAWVRQHKQALLRGCRLEFRARRRRRMPTFDAVPLPTSQIALTLTSQSATPSPGSVEAPRHLRHLPFWDGGDRGGDKAAPAATARTPTPPGPIIDGPDRESPPPSSSTRHCVPWADESGVTGEGSEGMSESAATTPYALPYATRPTTSESAAASSNVSWTTALAEDAAAQRDKDKDETTGSDFV